MQAENAMSKNASGISGGKTGRIEWLDILRALAMYLVVIGHATDNNSPDYYKFYIYSFHMPLFFMISGASFYLQMKSKNWGFGTLVKNKARGFLWPYVTLNFITFWIWVLNFKVLSHSDSSLGEKIYATLYSNEEYLTAPSNATWFLPTLFLTTLAFYLLQRWSDGNEKILILSIAMAGVTGYACSLYKETIPLPWHVDTVPIALLMFLIGYLFVKHLEDVKQWLGDLPKQIIIFIVCMGIGYFCARSNIKISMASNNYGSFLLFMGSSLSFSLALMLVSVWVPKFRILKFIGRNTIVYLAFHAPIFRFIEVVSDESRRMFEQHPTIVSSLVFIALIPIAYIFEKYLGILLGRKKKHSLQ